MENKLQTAVQIAEEIESSIFPVVTATQNEAEPDTYLMCRGIHRQAINLAQQLRELNKDYIMEGETHSFRDMRFELEPAHVAINKSRVFINALIENERNDERAVELSILSDLVFTAIKEIERIRGEEL
ncbi:hypothetical protein Xsto_03882 [Xenorhabdus stockiae]|uniref:Uncharacterized protein n=1 Tax=Xenorhabdus stockiae TaxID=351614 RepID=A0A2D0KB43_9GAMM|nr:hypothetical protein [Xenorhabdus stockiae]PHM60545.1 hypothetical protein Xsto_03882 [Xenorhabdus stockiae]